MIIARVNIENFYSPYNNGRETYSNNTTKQLQENK